MRVAAYNIWDGGVNEAAGDRRERILNVVREIKADLVAVAEACGFDETLARWERDLGMQGAIGRAPSGYHVALFARPPYQIRSAGSIHVPVFYHACLSARVAGPEGDVHVLAAHFNPFDPDSRLAEARHLAREAYDHRPVLLLGDLNALSPRDTLDDSIGMLSPRVRARHIAVDGGRIDERPAFDTRAIALLEWAGFMDLHRKLNGDDPGWTLPTGATRKRELARMRLDYVLATKPLADRARLCKVVRTPDSDVASDHYPLLAEFAP